MASKTAEDIRIISLQAPMPCFGLRFRKQTQRHDDIQMHTDNQPYATHTVHVNVVALGLLIRFGCRAHLETHEKNKTQLN